MHEDGLECLRCYDEDSFILTVEQLEIIKNWKSTRTLTPGGSSSKTTNEESPETGATNEDHRTP